MVRFEKVTKKFGAIVALQDISFEVKEGEFVFITGPSGSGKTTLIRLLLRELTPDAGRISIEGRDIATLKGRDMPFYRRKIGVVFQDFKLIPDRTVYENVGLALEISGEVSDKKIKEVLEEVELAERASLFPRQLAGGELQRAVLARALVGGPKLILADEPTGNLDPATAREIVRLFDHAAHGGTTVLMATHNADIVNALKHRVINLKRGKIVGDKKNGGYEE
ncbi:MAG: ATP-binding cassette domain-containing protein [Candidatus Blackburnbacteria bacterium]|nr:ATP-binding cassette domain-containing protein [Candidatus Blackburnbacteria bacterium]